MIDINDITVRIGTKVLLEHTGAHIPDGAKVGLVGTNGCGKTSLFRVLQGELETESGSVIIPEHTKVASVAQEITDLEQPILDFVLAQDKDLSSLQQRLQTASSAEIADLHERLKSLGANSAPARAASILYGLGFSNSDLSRKIKEFSGGWQKRLSLAAALFQPSDILLLDEPTNHLDLETALWLENHLRKYRGTLLLISHDRSILNSLCTHIIHFDHGRLVSYSGNYDTFSRTRAEQKEHLEKQQKKQEQQRHRLESFVERFRYKATKARQAQSRIKMLAKLPPITLMSDDSTSHFDFPEVDELAPPYLSVENASVGYGGAPVLSRLNFSIVNNDRIALLGANGNGKSTLAKLISGRLQATEGTIHRSSKLRIGYFAQHQTEELPADKTALEYLSQLMPSSTETTVRSHLASFGLEQEKALTKISNLSGGEKSRLLFAAISRDSPQLLILDEPTNHLDIQARSALIEALNNYQGSVILISHDFNLLEMVADDLWLVSQGRCRPFDGDLEDYKQFLLHSSDQTDKQEQRRQQEALRQKQEAKAAAKQTREAERSRQQRLKQLESSIQQKQHRIQELENLFQTPLSVEDSISYQKELKQLQSDVEAAENLWLELSC